MTDHVHNQLCARIEELESEKMELNEQLDSLQDDRDSYQREFARATEVLGEIHESLNGGGPAIVGMEAVQVRQLKGERDALAAHVERLSRVLRDISGATTGAEGRHYSMNDELYRVRDLAHTALQQLADELRQQAEGERP